MVDEGSDSARVWDMGSAEAVWAKVWAMRWYDWEWVRLVGAQKVQAS